MKNTTGLKRNTIDKYYTKPSVARMCYEIITRKIKISQNDLIIEPSAGNGVFIPYIKKLSKHHLFYDIKPEHQEIQQMNFLNFDAKIVKKYNKVHVIGNPPFGRQSSDVKKFIRKCSKFCHTISFILPITFKKKSMQKVFPLNFHLIKEQILSPNSFLIDDREHDVPCVFQIWEKKKSLRKKRKRLIPSGYSFVPKTKHPDICIRRVGYYTGKISQDCNKNENTHYFIKFARNIDKKNTILKLQSIKYKIYNVGPKSISKQQIIEKFNNIIQLSIS